MHENEVGFTEDPGLTTFIQKCHIAAPMWRGFVWDQPIRNVKSSQYPEHHKGSQNSTVVKSCMFWNKTAWV